MGFFNGLLCFSALLFSSLSYLVYRSHKVHIDTIRYGYLESITSPLIVITGANSGIGKETARVLAKSNARLVLGCRSIHKGEQAKADILQIAPNTSIKVSIIKIHILEKFI